jgi:uncharacterized phage-associated protein
MMHRFNQRKATQVAGMLLQLRQNDGVMSYMKLIKLMYLIDREALLRWGWSMTGDDYVSMKHGQVLSKTFNLIRQLIFGDMYWYRFISAPFGDKEVRLLQEPESDELSRADRALIQEIFDRFGTWERFALAKYTHDELPEYQETTSSIPTEYEEVMRKSNIPEEKIRRIFDEGYTLSDLEALATQ